MNKKYPTFFLTWFNKFSRVPYPGTQLAQSRSCLSTRRWRLWKKIKTLNLFCNVVTTLYGTTCTTKSVKLNLYIWKLMDVTSPPHGIKMHEQWFMEPTLEGLMTCPTPTNKPTLQPPPMQECIWPVAPNWVDHKCDNDDEGHVTSIWSKNHCHAEIADGCEVHHSSW